MDDTDYARMPVTISVGDAKHYGDPEARHEVSFSSGEGNGSTVVNLTDDELMEAETAIADRVTTMVRNRRKEQLAADPEASANPLKVSLRAEVEGRERTDNLIAVMSAAMSYGLQHFPDFREFAAQLCEDTDMETQMAAWFRTMTMGQLALMTEAVIDASLPEKMA